MDTGRVTHGPAGMPPREGWGLTPRAAAMLFLALAAAPLALAAVSGEEPGHWHEEAGLALGLSALSLLLLQFAHAGRWPLVSGRTAIDVTMRFHRAAAILLLAFVLLHPVAFVTPLLLRDPWQGLARLQAMVASPRMTVGLVAWVALVATVLMALARRLVAYHVWRLLHGIGGAVAASGAVWHAVSLGVYSGFGPLALLWWAGLGGAVLLLLWSWGWKPWRLATAGWRVSAVSPLGPGYWEVRLSGGTVPRFAAGQFVWLAFGRAAPWNDNPFSIASAPDAGHLGFVIREAGDLTRGIGALPLGLPVRVDGPHGAFTLDRAGPGPLLLIAGGAGIAPILSIARHLDAVGKTRPIALLHCARSASRLVCRAELGAIARRRSWRTLFLAEEDEADGVARGMPDRQRLEALLAGWNPAEAGAMLCGPEPMTMAVARMLEGIGVSPDRIVYELFDYA
jgi:predicted ferric reductase